MIAFIMLKISLQHFGGGLKPSQNIDYEAAAERFGQELEAGDFAAILEHDCLGTPMGNRQEKEKNDEISFLEHLESEDFRSFCEETMRG